MYGKQKQSQLYELYLNDINISADQTSTFELSFEKGNSFIVICAIQSKND